MNQTFRPKNKKQFLIVSANCKTLLKKALMILSGCAVLLMICGTGFGQKVSSATSQFNGTWRKGGDVIKIWQLGGRRLKVEYEGLYEYKYQGEPIANVGTAKGSAIIHGNAADFQDGTNANCKMTLKLSRGKLNLESTGCTFGQHVNVSGIYRKMSSRRPKFDW